MHTHNIPSDGQTESDAKKDDQSGNGPEYDCYGPIRRVIRFSELLKIVSPAWQHLRAPPNANREENDLNEHPRAD
jgi:hypothetical protein